MTRAEFARIAGVSASAVSKACKAKLRRAVVGRRIDLDHEDAVAYLENRGIDPTSVRESPPKSRKPAPAERPPPLDIAAPAEIAELTIREVVRRFGTQTRFRDWLQALKAIEDIQEKRLRNETANGRLIERELVKTHVFGAIDATNRRLLADTPRTVAQRIYAMARSEAPVEEAEKVVREAIASQLAPVRTSASRALRKQAAPATEPSED